MGETFLDSPSFAEFLRGIPSPTVGDLGDLEDLEDLPYVILEVPSVSRKQLSQQLFIPQQPLVVQEQPFIPQQPLVVQQQPFTTQEQQPFIAPTPLVVQEQPFISSTPSVGQQHPSTALQAFYEADFLGTPEEGYEHIKLILGVQCFKVMGNLGQAKPCLHPPLPLLFICIYLDPYPI